VVPALEFEFNGHKFYDDLVYYIPITDDHALDSLHPGCLKSSVMHTGTRKIARRRYTSRFQREGERAKRNGEMRRTGRRKKTRGGGGGGGGGGAGGGARERGAKGGGGRGGRGGGRGDKGRDAQQES